MDISPVQNAINTVRERMNKLKNAYERIEKLKEVDEGTKSLIQGTVDPGVNGGLPKYTKFMDKDYKEANPESIQKSDELKVLIIETINLADTLLDACLRINLARKFFLYLQDKSASNAENIKIDQS
jgi:hypothetical protein